MNEREYLEKLVEEGFIAHMIIRTPSNKELIKNKLDQYDYSKKIKALPMVNYKKSEQIMFYFYKDDTYELAEQLVKNESKPISFHYNIICKAFTYPPGRKNNINLDTLIKQLNNQTDWEVSLGESSNELHFYKEIPADSEINIYKEELEELLLNLSLSNDLVSFLITGDSHKKSPVYVNHPSVKKIGLSRISPKYDPEIRLPTNDKGIVAATALQLAKAANTELAALSLMWEAMVHCFEDKSLYEKVFPKDIVKEIMSSKVFTNYKKKEQDIVKSGLSSIFKPKRNKLIAREISKITEENSDMLFQKIEDAFHARGKAVHSLSGSIIDFEDHYSFFKYCLSLLL